MLRKKKKVWSFLVLLLLFLSALLLFSGNWLLQTWNQLSMDELIYHLKTPLKGTNPALIGNYLLCCLLPAVALVLFFTVIFYLSRRKQFWLRIFLVGSLILSMVMLGITIYQLVTKLELQTFAESVTVYSDFIDENYVEPSEVTLTFSEKKRNLIHIYLESMETTYADADSGGSFSENVIPELTKLALENEDFSNSQDTINGAISLSGSTWTMGALFAQTAGLPLSLPIDGNAMSGQSSFLPTVTALGDLLEDAGYQQAFLIGSDGAFGGRDLYYTEHGHAQIWDYHYFVSTGQIPEDYYVFWGFEDKYLIEFAKEKLTWLSQQEQPFHLSMLTVDTHFENGYLCSDCETYYANDPYSNVMRCSSEKIGELIAWIQEQDFYENTTIVLTGDHLTMDSDYCGYVPEDYQRKVFTTFINAPITAATKEARTYSTFDIFPTTLASLGVTIDGNRLALGTNLFSDEPTLCEKYDISYINKELKKQSLLMDELTADVTYAKGAITADGYNIISDSFDVSIDNMQHSVDIVDLRCLVWTKEDRSDAKWFIQSYEGDRNYDFQISTLDFSSDAQIYQIEVYAYTKDTMMYKLGSTNFIK